MALSAMLHALLVVLLSMASSVYSLPEIGSDGSVFLQRDHLIHQRQHSRFEMRAGYAHQRGHLQIAHALLQDNLVAGVMVLTTGNKEGEDRLRQLTDALGRGLRDFNVTRLVGLDMHQFKNEEEEMAQDIIPMTENQRSQWLLTDMGFGPIHGNKGPKEFGSNGALACSLGHWKMWEMASHATSGKWTIFLEDDAKLNPGITSSQVTELLSKVPDGVDEVFLDDRHCQAFGGHVGVVQGEAMNHYAMGSTAYALTAAGARAMLQVPFRYPSDHWLNMPVRSGAIKAFCPNGKPIFLHEYEHRSVINSFLQHK